MALKEDALAQYWQLECVGLRERAWKLLQEEQWTDCSFLVGLDVGVGSVELVKAHKLILGMASPVFQAMFYGLMAEGMGAIPIPDMQPDTFKAMLEYIYTDNYKITSDIMAIDLYYGAQKYMLPRLMSLCTMYVCVNLSPETVCGVYEFSDMVGETKLKLLKLVSKNMILSKAKNVFESSGFLELSLDTVAEIFSWKLLEVKDELVLIRAADRYNQALEAWRQDDSSGQEATNHLKTIKLVKQAMNGQGDGDTGHGHGQGDGDTRHGHGQGDGDTRHGHGQGDGDTGHGHGQGDGDTGHGHGQGDGDTRHGHGQGDGDTGHGHGQPAGGTLDVKPATAASGDMGHCSQDAKGENGEEFVSFCEVEDTKNEEVKDEVPDREILKVLREIRFLSLSAKQIAKERCLLSLLTRDELLAILVNAADDDGHAILPMPKGFSTDKNARCEEREKKCHSCGKNSAIYLWTPSAYDSSCLRAICPECKEDERCKEKQCIRCHKKSERKLWTPSTRDTSALFAVCPKCKKDERMPLQQKCSLKTRKIGENVSTACDDDISDDEANGHRWEIASLFSEN